MSKSMVTVLNRCNLRPGQVEVAAKLYEDWVQFLQKQPECKSIELVCCVEGQLIWLEQWSSKTALDKFVHEHMTYTDHTARFYAASRGAPTRDIYQQVR